MPRCTAPSARQLATHPGLREAALDVREAAHFKWLWRRRGRVLAPQRRLLLQLGELAQVVGVVVVAELGRCEGEKGRRR